MPCLQQIVTRIALVAEHSVVIDVVPSIRHVSHRNGTGTLIDLDARASAVAHEQLLRHKTHGYLLLVS